MPYIKQERRAQLLTGSAPENVGELNYLVCSLLHRHFEVVGRSYETYNDTIGQIDQLIQGFSMRTGWVDTADKLFLSYYENNPTTGYEQIHGVLRCVQLELYRRAVAVYEDSKKQANGDIPLFDF